MAGFEEELIITVGGTVRTSDRILTIGCDAIHYGGASLGFSTDSGEVHRMQSIEPSQSLSLVTRTLSCRVVLLSVRVDGSEAVRVRASHSPIETSPTLGKDPHPAVRVLETTKSCHAELMKIVRDAVADKNRQVLSDEGSVSVFKLRGLFGRVHKFIVITNGHKDQHGRHFSLFPSGKWEDLRIDVHEPDFLDSSQKIADAYHARTGARVTIHKDF